MANKKQYTHNGINLVNMAFAIGQINQDESFSVHAERVIDYAKAFTSWEVKNVLCLENGWETYMENGGEDYESVIYEWAEKFRI
jgi:hypothetical protein